MEKVQPKGAIYIESQPGEALSVEPTVGHLVLSNGTRVQVKRAWLNAASNGTREVIPAKAGVVFRVLSLFMLGGGTAPTVTFKSGSDAISPDFTNAANGGAVLPFTPYGWFQTLVINEALNATISNSSDVGIIALYIELTDDLFDLL